MYKDALIPRRFSINSLPPFFPLDSLPSCSCLRPLPSSTCSLPPPCQSPSPHRTDTTRPVEKMSQCHRWLSFARRLGCVVSTVRPVHRPCSAGADVFLEENPNPCPSLLFRVAVVLDAFVVGRRRLKRNSHQRLTSGRRGRRRSGRRQPWPVYILGEISARCLVGDFQSQNCRIGIWIISCDLELFIPV